jgi:histone H3/H4
MFCLLKLFDHPKKQNLPKTATEKERKANRTMDENITENYEYLDEQQMILDQPEYQKEEGDMMGDSVFGNVGQGLEGHYRNMMMAYWQETINSIEHEEHDFKNHQLPLARIKKVMKTDEEVRMISAEAPILFAKGCDIFITELTMRAWIHAEENKRRTLQRSDIAAALQKSDMFDFLIDIVPREEDRKRQSRQGSYYEGERQFAQEREQPEYQYENYEESNRY